MPCLAPEQETKQIPRFHHTSFLAAEPVQVAGQLEVREGRLQSINLHSGHYRPREDRDLVRPRPSPHSSLLYHRLGCARANGQCLLAVDLTQAGVLWQLSFLDVLEENGVDLATIRVDVQRMLKSSRHAAPRAGAVVVKERKRGKRSAPVSPRQ